MFQALDTGDSMELSYRARPINRDTGDEDWFLDIFGNIDTISPQELSPSFRLPHSYGNHAVGYLDTIDPTTITSLHQFDDGPADENSQVHAPDGTESPPSATGPQTSLVDRQDVVANDDETNNTPEIAGPPRLRCEHHKCSGNFTGPHQCAFQPKGAVLITCAGGNDCRSIFKKAHAFNRHYDTVHRQARTNTPEKIDCPFPNCARVGAKGFNPARPDNLKQHRRTVHKEDMPKVRVRFGQGGNNASLNAGPVVEPSNDQD